MSSINDDTWFVIKNLDEFIDSTRALVFNNFGKTYKENQDILDFAVKPSDIKELNSVLSFPESELIVRNLMRKQINKTKKTIRYLINDKIYLNIISDLNDRMVSNILNGLVNKGLVETAYDEESNDFIFWLKKENEEENQKFETD